MKSKVAVYTDAETVELSNELFFIGSDKKPDLIPLGIPPIDIALGGLGPGACGILAASTGVGKSSIMLRAMASSPVKVGCVSLEDGFDVIGPRLGALYQNIESIRIRRNTVTESQAARLLKLPGQLVGKANFAFVAAGRLEQVEEAVELLAKAGCRMIWLGLPEGRGTNALARTDSAMVAAQRNVCADSSGLDPSRSHSRNSRGPRSHGWPWFRPPSDPGVEYPRLRAPLGPHIARSSSTRSRSVALHARV